MIKKLKVKFILLSMASLLLLLAFVIGAMNIMSFSSVSQDADKVLEVLSANEGRFPEHKEPKNKHNGVKHALSPEAPYESRYFTVLLDKSGNVIQSNTSKIKSIDTKQAIEYSLSVFKSGKEKGFADIYRYAKTESNGETRITFLDCRKQLETFYDFLCSSLFVSAVGYVVVFIIIFFCSGKIIRPIAESYEKQKRFITDAGHEIKTPLTIIKANTDILEAEIGTSESLDDIRTQTERLTELTNDLVYLAKMEEKTDSELIDIPLSDIIEEAAESFVPLAAGKNVTLNISVEPMLTVHGNTKQIQQLINILLENAVKYSVDNSVVYLKLYKRGKYSELCVTNKSKAIVSKEDLNKVFDRFYRSDLSRNSETGGYGIGLSIAKAVVSKHNGKIYAEYVDEHTFKIKVNFPQ